jgi:hypothetical protein
VTLRRAAAAAAVATAFAACGEASPTGGGVTFSPPVQTTAPSSSPSPSPSSSASPNPSQGAVLTISQLNIAMTLPRGLSQVNYEIVPSSLTLSDANGVEHKAVGEIDFTTPDCPGSGSALVVTVWDVDPGTLTGMGYGGAVPGSDTKAGAQWLHVESADGGSPAGCSAATVAALQQLVASATATQ